MVFYFKSRCGNFTIYMGKDKYENEGLIKYGLPEDVWFHVDDLSSAHVYLRMKPGMTMDDISNLWEDFRAISGDETSVPITQLKEMVMRQADDGPMDGDALQACMKMADEDGEGELTFSQYCRATWAECQVDL